MRLLMYGLARIGILAMECIAVPVVSLSETRVESGVWRECIWGLLAWTRGVLLLLLGSRHVVLAEICWSLAARTLDCAQLVPGVRAGAACAGRVGRGVRSPGDTSWSAAPLPPTRHRSSPKTGDREVV